MEEEGQPPVLQQQPSVLRGIDGRGNSRAEAVGEAEPEKVAQYVLFGNWKYARLDHGGRKIGELTLDPVLLRRTWTFTSPGPGPHPR